MPKLFSLLAIGMCIANLSAEEDIALMQTDALCAYQIPQAKRGKAEEPGIRNFCSHIDFLYWQANEDGLEYGTKMVATPLLGEAATVSTKLLDLDFKWDPGFCLGFGYTFDTLDWWTLNLNWTHIHNHAHGSATALGIETQTGIVNTIISPWVNLLFELRAGATKASSYWHLYYDTLDLDFGRSVRLSPYFEITPFFGLRGGWVHQHYTANYDTILLPSEGSPPVHRGVTFRGTNNFNGIGFRTGTELFCFLPRNWHLFSGFSANILYGKFSVHMRNLNDQGIGAIPLNFYASEEFWRARLAFAESIGFGWDSYSKCERYRLRLRAAYEFNQWLSQNEFFYTEYFRGTDTISITPIRNQGNLSFQGVRLSADLDY